MFHNTHIRAQKSVIFIYFNTEASYPRFNINTHLLNVNFIKLQIYLIEMGILHFYVLFHLIDYFK